MPVPRPKKKKAGRTINEIIRSAMRKIVSIKESNECNNPIVEVENEELFEEVCSQICAVFNIQQFPRIPGLLPELLVEDDLARRMLKNNAATQKNDGDSNTLKNEADSTALKDDGDSNILKNDDSESDSDQVKDEPAPKATPPPLSEIDELISSPPYLALFKQWQQLVHNRMVLGETVCSTFDDSVMKVLLMKNTREIYKELEKTSVGSSVSVAVCAICKEIGMEDQEVKNLVALAEGPLERSESVLPSETGLGFLARDSGGAKEEGMGVISFECITNDGEPDKMRKLITLKNIFSRQLPKMPREYIVRLVFDRNHYSFCLLKQKRVIGGVCFRPYFQHKFAEIAFLAVTSSEQVKGYGTRLMNHLKEHVKQAGIEYFLTYADNTAIEYFKKQGFATKLSLPRERWLGYIKDYDGGTLVECKINASINYLYLSSMLRQQSRAVRNAIRLLRPDVACPGLSWDGKTEISIKDIPGLSEVGWKEEEVRETPISKPDITLKGKMMEILTLLLKHDKSWPFRKPVSSQEAPDYHEIIKTPMDISTMKKKVRVSAYANADQFAKDVELMFDNCRWYNHNSTIYYKYANELQKFISPHVEALKLIT